MRTLALVAVTLLVAGSGAARGQAVPPLLDEPPVLDEFGEVEEPQSLRERLTEREDELRIPDPAQIDLFGRPLTVSGEYEIALDFARRLALGPEPGDSRALRLEQELEAEIFYPLGGDAYFFLQGLVGMERFLHAPDGTGQVETWYAERGETWLYFRNLLDGRLQLEVGRLDYEDDRTWWFDDELDSIRIELEGEDVDVALALARELAPARTDLDGIEPDQDGVLRLVGEAGWEWADEHALELYLIHQSDHSYTEPVGRVVSDDREDDSDATLTWIGPRAIGGWEAPTRGVLGYWLDAAHVRGRDTALDFEDLGGGRGEVVARTRRDVRAWAVDGGLTWVAPVAYEPRVTLAFAVGSGDDGSPDGSTDRAFRQSGLQGNEAANGGVERFHYYGVLLEPELSNLRVLTLGLGLSLLESSSLDLVFHDYRLLERADELRDATLELELDGRDRHLGSELDLVLAVEEWERFQFEVRGAAFRAGAAVADPRRDWTWGAFGAFRFAF